MPKILQQLLLSLSSTRHSLGIEDTELNQSWFLFLRAYSLTEKTGLVDVPRDVSGLKERSRLCILGA